VPDTEKQVSQPYVRVLLQRESATALALALAHNSEDGTLHWEPATPTAEVPLTGAAGGLAGQ